MRTTIVAILTSALFGGGIALQAQSKGTLSAGDMAEIQVLYARYAQAFDSGNKDAYGGVFTPDGVFMVGTDRVLTGPKEIASLISGPRRDRPKIFHVNSNVVIDPSPEGAKGSVYVVLMDLTKNPAITGGGVYEDTLVKTKDGWRFKKRIYYAEPGPAAAKPATQSSAK